MCNPLGGVALGWWKRSHNVHHVVCNSIEDDPDIQHLPLMAVDTGIFAKYFSTYHQREMAMDAVARAAVSYQHVVYFPLMALARFNLYLQSYLLLLSREKCQHRRLEIMGLIVFGCWYPTLLYTALGSWQEILAYMLISHGVAGILHVQITISHFAEACTSNANQEEEWLLRQTSTSLNVACESYMDWFHGGLQFQVEHHMFPRLPRHNLRAVRNEFKAFMEANSLVYNEMPFVDCVARVMKKLREVAVTARGLKQGNGGYWESALHSGLNAVG